MADPVPAPAPAQRVPVPPGATMLPLAGGGGTPPPIVAPAGTQMPPAAAPEAVSRLVPAPVAVPALPPEPPPQDLGEIITRRSESIAALTLALSKAQGKITGASKDSSNPHFKSKYASLSAVWDACRGPLSENELAVIQLVGGQGRRPTVTTLLSHSSGEWIESILCLTAQQDNAPAVGSAITYARRYMLSGIAGVAPEDDDGQAAMDSLPGGVRRDSRSTPLQQQARQQEETAATDKAQPVSRIEGQNGAVTPAGLNAQMAAAPVAMAGAVPPPPGKPPAKAPGAK